MPSLFLGSEIPVFPPLTFHEILDKSAPLS